MLRIALIKVSPFSSSSAPTTKPLRIPCNTSSYPSCPANASRPLPFNPGITFLNTSIGFNPAFNPDQASAAIWKKLNPSAERFEIRIIF